MSCLLSASPRSLYLQLTPRVGINSAAQQIRGYCIRILQLRSPVGALPSLYETPVCCCPASATLLGEGRGQCIPPRVTAASLQQGSKELKPISPSQHFQQELSSWELPCPAGNGMKISCSEAGGEKNRGARVW